MKFSRKCREKIVNNNNNNNNRKHSQTSEKKLPPILFFILSIKHALFYVEIGFGGKKLHRFTRRLFKVYLIAFRLNDLQRNKAVTAKFSARML